MDLGKADEEEEYERTASSSVDLGKADEEEEYERTASSYLPG